MAKQKVTAYYYDPYFTEGNIYIGNNVNGGGGQSFVKGSLILKNNPGIFGIPYQFLSSVDRRLSDDGQLAGRKYAEKILGRMPLLYLVPCRQKFMEGFSAKDQHSVINALVSGTTDLISGLTQTGRYYTTEYAFGEYYNMVNRMSTVVSKYMGLADIPVVDGKGQQVNLNNLTWQNMNSGDFKQYFMAKNAVVFYTDGLSSISDSFSNSTMESSLANSINSFSEQAKEIRFLLGNDSMLLSLADNLSEGIMSAIEGSKIQGVTEFLTGGMIADLGTTGVSTVLSGGKLIFPKIWSDSNFSRSYSFDIKLRSPDHDSLSIFMNVIAPYLHLLALVLPQSIVDDNTARQSPNAYTSPFLVRAYCKGMFNINMGIITDMSATRGRECEWNDDGLPTQIDISITIEDLYSTIFATNVGGKVVDLQANWDLVTNTEFMDYLANLSGLNVATDVNDTVGISRKTAMLSALNKGSVARIDSTIGTYFETGIANLMRQFWDIFN